MKQQMKQLGRRILNGVFAALVGGAVLLFVAVVVLAALLAVDSLML